VTSSQLGWFGKLPCAGDFVHRRLPRSLLDGLDNWLQQGMSQLRATYPTDWRGIYGMAHTWNCAIPGSFTQGGETLIGLLAPSRDRVGREFPLWAGVALDAGVSPLPWLASAHDWLTSLGRILAYAKARPSTIDAFDVAVQSITMPLPSAREANGVSDILSVLNANDEPGDVSTIPMPLAHTLPWPDLPTLFDADGVTSFWWTNTGTGAPLRGFLTEAGLAPSLLLTLMRPQFGAPRGRR